MAHNFCVVWSLLQSGKKIVTGTHSMVSVSSKFKGSL
ncbi:Uncharacterised protein [Vibrio cholerae]|nr:Uncharacterised protein [Vibrio cholerae]CSD50603.1 Uncharacterised protein [Vibrio cholerae]